MPELIWAFLSLFGVPFVFIGLGVLVLYSSVVADDDDRPYTGDTQPLPEVK